MDSKKLIALLGLARKVTGLPISGAVDSSYDAWATALSDVGPLILLIGERSTKQLLRDVRGFSESFSLAAAPLGLVSIVTSLLRISGSHRLRSFLGYEQESRSIAALEMSRINCNGIHAELIDGYLIRTTAAVSALHAGAIGVSILQAEASQSVTEELVNQISACHAYVAKKTSLGIPESDAKLGWCLHLKIGNPGDPLTQSALRVIYTGLQLDYARHPDDIFRKQLQRILSRGPSRDASQSSTESEKLKVVAWGKATVCFTYTFEAISEFCTAVVTSRAISMLIGLLALSTIWVFYLIELGFILHWRVTTGWLLVVIGYCGIVTFVSFAALRIQGASQTVALRTKSSLPWQSGLVIAAQSDGKAGAAMLRPSSGKTQAYQASWLKPLTRASCVKADMIAVFLTLSFLSHYLGLRSSSWWLGVCELGTCLAAAFARSLTKSRPAKYKLDSVPGERQMLDWRCCSTGVITASEGQEVDAKAAVNLDQLDLRLYSDFDELVSPALAESIAWYCAELCLKDVALIDWLLTLTGMQLCLSTNPLQPERRAVVASSFCTVITQEGIASADTTTCVAFSASIESLAAPTGLLARGAMRQPGWRLNRKLFCSMMDTLGKVHIPALNPWLTWWTVSELRNGPRENQENLQWAFILLNTVFFVLLRKDFSSDQNLLNTIESLNATNRQSAQLAARDLYARLQQEATPISN